MMRIPKFNPQIPCISLVLMRTCTTSCDLSLLLSLSSSLRWLRSPCPPLRHQACSLCSLCTYSSSAQLWVPPAIHVARPPSFFTSLLTGRLIRETSHDPPPPSPSPLPCFGCLHNICHHLIFYIFICFPGGYQPSPP